MSSEARAKTIANLVTVCKKHFPAVVPPEDRPVFDHLLYSCIIQDSDFLAADEAFARLQQYADWNEVRVSTVVELSENMAGLKDPEKAAERLKNVLHSVFETHYSFDLGFLVKESQGNAVKVIERYHGLNKFSISYMIQNSFSGHKIPVDAAFLEVADILGLLTPKDKKTETVPGLDRAVAKTKGPEFFSSIHSLAAKFAADPFDEETRAILLEINPECESRLPQKTQAKKKTATRKSPKKPSKKTTKTAKKKPEGGNPSQKQPSKKLPTKKATPSKPAASKKSAGGKKPTKKIRQTKPK